MTCTFAAAPDALDDLPASAKLVWHVLAIDGGKLTQQQLVRRVPIEATTVRYSLRDLQNAGCVESRPCVRDARKRHYWAVTD